MTEKKSCTPSPSVVRDKKDRVRCLLLSLRQARLIELGALEEFLDLPRTKEPKSRVERS